MTFSAASALADVLGALREVPRRPSEYASARDADLLEVARLVAEISKLADAHGVLAAGQLEARSRPEHGAQGVARREGARTATELLSVTMGLTGRDAAATVRLGRLSTERGPLAVVADRIAEGTLSVPAADAIQAGLDVPGSIDDELLARAAELLCDEARRLDPDRLRKRAREVRDELDEEGVADREALLRSRRSLRRIDLRDGMKRLIWDYDPISAGVIDEIYDRATSPRMGGPRFVDADQAARAERLERDDRTTAQLAADAFTELLRQSATVDEAVLLGGRAPAVRVLVWADDLEAGAGHGVVEGANESLSIGTTRWLACANGTRPALVDSLGNVLDLGREQRLYSANQRLALAIRDGGCLWPGCERPPSWCEAHHVDHWARDGGRTDVDRGVLLCRHHHLKLHNEGWEIRRRAGRFWLEPPPGDRGRGALLETRSRAIRERLVRVRPLGTGGKPGGGGRGDGGRGGGEPSIAGAARSN